VSNYRLGLATGLICVLMNLPAAAQTTITISSAGGTVADGLRAAQWGPAATKLGFVVREETTSDGLAALKLQVQSGSVTSDIVHLGSGEGASAGKDGLLTPIDYSVIDAKSVPAGAAAKYCFPFDSYGTVLAWNTATYGENGPKSWADFWDVKKFPGRRAMRANAQAQLEIALLADGVAKEDIYKILSTPEGLKRAVDKIAQLRPAVAVWWTSGAQSTQLLKDGEVDMIISWNGRMQNAIDDGAKAQYTFNQAVIGTDCFAVPKGAPHAAEAMKMISLMTTPEAEAALTKYIMYGPMNVHAYENGLIPADRMAKLATAPANAASLLVTDDAWWVDNDKAAQVAFDEMMQQGQ